MVAVAVVEKRVPYPQDGGGVVGDISENTARRTGVGFVPLLSEVKGQRRTIVAVL